MPDISTYLRGYYKDNNPEKRVKDDKNLEELLTPFHEKSIKFQTSLNIKL